MANHNRASANIENNIPVTYLIQALGILLTFSLITSKLLSASVKTLLITVAYISNILGGFKLSNGLIQIPRGKQAIWK